MRLDAKRVSGWKEEPELQVCQCGGDGLPKGSGRDTGESRLESGGVHRARGIVVMQGKWPVLKRRVYMKRKGL